jgi:hypothetical protein
MTMPSLKMPPGAAGFRDRDTTGPSALCACSGCTMHQPPALPSYPGNCSAVDVQFIPDADASAKVCDLFESV